MSRPHEDDRGGQRGGRRPHPRGDQRPGQRDDAPAHGQHHSAGPVRGGQGEGGLKRHYICFKLKRLYFH